MVKLGYGLGVCTLFGVRFEQYLQYQCFGWTCILKMSGGSGV